MKYCITCGLLMASTLMAFSGGTPINSFNWHLKFLSAQCTRHFWNDIDLIRHVVRRKVRAQPIFNVFLQLIRQFNTWTQHHKKRHIVTTTWALHPDNQTVKHLRYVLHHAIDLAAAHTNALAVDCRVRAAINHSAASGCNLYPVAMPPDSGEHLKVALAIAFALGIVPEVERHRRHRLGDDQFPHLIDQRLAVIIESLNLCSKCAALKFTGMNRQQHRTAHEAGAYIRSATKRGDP